MSRQNIIEGIYNEKTSDRSGRLSNGQDRKFVENMKIGDIVLIPFSGSHECIVARIVSNVEYSIDSGLRWNEEENQIKIGNNLEMGGLPFRPVGRHIEIICDNFVPDMKLGQWSLSKMNKGLVARLNSI